MEDKIVIGTEAMPLTLRWGDLKDARGLTGNPVEVLIPRSSDQLDKNNKQAIVFLSRLGGLSGP
jgi:hypothetical protein